MDAIHLIELALLLFAGGFAIVAMAIPKWQWPLTQVAVLLVVIELLLSGTWK